MADSVLARLFQSPSLFSSEASPTPLQAEVDSVLSNLKEELTNPSLIVAEVTGAGVYASVRRMGCQRALSFLKKAAKFDREITPSALAFYQHKKAFSTVAAVILGSAAHDLTLRSALTLTSEISERPNLWHWAGEGGIRDGFIRSILHFGVPLGFGELGFRASAPVFGMLPKIRPLFKGAMGILTFTLSQKALNKLGGRLGWVPIGKGLWISGGD